MSYSVLADYYDRLMSGYPYDEVLSRTLSVTVGDGLDLGAGTGEMTLRLSRSGRRMTAVDLSNEALNVARDKSRAMGQRITFLQGDIADMSFGERRFGFVTAFCDVINYITEESSVKTLFSNVYSALVEGGTLIFDISAVEKLEALVDGGQYFEDYDDVTYLWDNTLVDGIVYMDLTFFERDGEVYKRRDESHEMRIYTEQYISDLLQSIGFSEIETTVLGSEVLDRRILFIARKI